MRKALLIFLILILILVAWFWWNRPRKVDMTAYVPADTLIYLEANDLPEIASGIVSTDAWKALAPPAGIRSDVGRIGLLSRLASWTGIGPAEVVVFSRAQIAISVLGFDAVEEEGSLKIKPRYAVVVETHSSESRTRYAIEKRVGDFARRAYREPRVEQKEMDGVHFTRWLSPDGSHRIIAAVTGSVAIVGNDESAVGACLAVRRNERPSMKDNPRLAEMRGRVGGKDALAFAYVSPEGSTRLLELGATAYAGQISSDPRAQSAAASLLPTLAKKTLGEAGWSAHLSNGAIEDRYYLSLQNGVAERLHAALASETSGALTATELLPADAYSLSRYNPRDPAAAWRGLKTVTSSQLDTLGAILITRLFDDSLKRYGIDDPDRFLRATGSELVTARLDDSGSSTVTIVEVRDEITLREFVTKHLGRRPRREIIGDAEMLVSNNEKRDAASFVGQRLVLGKEEHVRRCLEARATKQTLAATDDFQRTLQMLVASNLANVVTYTEDHDPARTFITAIATQKGATVRPFNETELENAIAGLRYAVSETQLVDGGFERRTRSSFGQFGWLASQFAPGGDLGEQK
ncbi:MAG TPA: hypothetical protein VF791_02785 [Pyrinomonadaceae bacterium]